MGRAVSIDGGVDFVMLPRPAFNADEVRIGGAVSDDFVAVERVIARLAFLPLLQGRLQFRELVLRRPEARMTRNAEGNIDFLGQAAPRRAVGSTNTGPSAAAPVDLDVDRVLIEDGSVAFQDVANETSLALRGIEAKIVARAMTPTSIAGTLTLGNTSLAIDASLGRPSSGGQTLSVMLKLPEADATAKFTGSLVRASEHNEVRGDVAVNGASAAALLAGFGIGDGAKPMPGVLRKPLLLSAKVHGNAEAVTVDITSLDLGGAPAKGTVVWRGLSPPSLDVKVEFGAVDLAAWRFASLDQVPALFPALVQSAHAQDAVPMATNVVFAPFKNLTATFDVRMPIMSYLDQTLRGGVFTAALVNRELKISEASIELPGATHVNTFGFVRFDEGATFDGAAEMQSGNLREVLNWLGIDAAQIPPGRLSNASLRAAVQGTPSHFSLADISATVDTSTITGRMSWSAGARPALGVDLTVSALNLDAYVTRPAKIPTTSLQPVEKETRPTAYGVTPKFTGFGGLTDMDADVRVQIEALTAGGIANGKVGIDIGLKDAVLNVLSASFENVAGATAWFSGSVSGFGISPRFDNVQFDLSVTDIPRLGRLFGWEAPGVLRTVTPVSLTGVLNGGFAEADVAATLKVAGMTIHADGKALTLDQQPHLTMNIDAAQPSYAALMRAAGAPWPVGMLDPGAVKASARVTYEKTATKIEGFSLRIGDNALSGDVNIARKDGHNDVSGTLSGVVFSFDRLWPKAQTAAFAPRADSGRPVTLVPTSEVWSQAPFHWSALQGWRGNVQVSGTALTVRGIQAQDFKFRLGISEGVLEVTEWSGKVFGAPGQIYLRAAAAPEPSVQGEIAFLGGDLGMVASAINGGTGGLKSGGKADFAGSFRMRGESPAAFAANISGSGTVKLATTEAGSGPISALLGAVSVANQLEGLSGQKGGTVTLESRFSAADGRIKIEDATVGSKSYGGAFVGTIDLPRWQVDLTGKLRLEAQDGGARPASVPIAVKGALDFPNITLLPP